MKIEQIPLSQLRPAPYNPRVVPPQVLAGITESIRKFGFQEPIVVNERNGGWAKKDRGLFIVGGHVRLQAAEALSMETVPCVRVRLKASEEKVLNVALNRGGDFDEPRLGGLIRELQALKVWMAPMGFLQHDLDRLIQAHEWGQEGEEVAPAPPLPLKATTKVGDLIELGRHRLLCGDAGDWNQVSRLLKGEPVELVVTDPPYNVNVEPRSNNAISAGMVSMKTYIDRGRRGGKHHQQLDLSRHPGKAKATGPMRAKDYTLKNDYISEEEFREKLTGWLRNIALALSPGRCFYLWGGYHNCFTYSGPLKDVSDLFFSQAIIWHKLHPVLTRKDFMGDHEWCFYGWKAGAAHFKNKAVHNCPDVWVVKKVNPQSMVHLTEKPVELAQRAIRFSSRPGERVLDLFAGSGSTLMAAELEGRTALCMELDPLYCDVIRKRYQDHAEKH